MEALAGLAAFGVACNVMQTIHFSLEACAVCKRVWQGQSPAPELDSYRASVQKAADDLQQSLVSSPQTPGQPNEPELQKTADDIIRIAKELEKELSDSKGSVTKYPRIAKILRMPNYLSVKIPRINRLSQSLSGLQETMELRILISLREKLASQNTFLEQGFKDLDQHTRNFVRQLDAGNTKLDTLIDRTSGEIRSRIERETEKSRVQATTNTQAIHDYVVDESRDTRACFKATLYDYRSTEAQRSQISILLDSLRYPEMYDRYNASAINNNHEGTYKWIFEDGMQQGRWDELRDWFRFRNHENVDKERRWDEFREWLRSDEKVYWISGKVGSGKSSLIRQLINDDRTTSYLRKWRTDAMVLSAFIWNAGATMQRSQVGLLATLLHQLFSNDEQTAVDYLKQNKSSLNKRAISDWSKVELLQILRCMFASGSAAACIFIDGLDEIDSKGHDGAFGLLDMLEDLTSLGNIKMCLGSREELVFDTRLTKCPRLRLQDLTRADIQKYVAHNLGKNFRLSPLTLRTLEEQCELIKAVVERADGVFLWVYLVTKSIRDGLLICDDWEGLTRRISILPQDLSELYAEMFKRRNNDDQKLYQAETALYFNFALSERHDSSLFRAALVSKPSLLRSFLSGGTEIKESYVFQQCQITRQRILANCVGLLEVSGLQVDGILTTNARVTFMHRTARDFLTDTQAGKQMLSYDVRTLTERTYTSLFSSMVEYACVVQSTARHTGKPQEDLRLDETMNPLYSSHYDSITSPVWTQASVNLSTLDLASSFLERQFQTAAIDKEMLNLAAATGSKQFLVRFIQLLSSSYSSDIQEWKSKILNLAFQSRHWRSSEQRLVKQASLITWLLHEGADPGILPNIDFSSPRMKVYQPTFILFLQQLRTALLSNDAVSNGSINTWMKLACALLEHGANTRSLSLQPLCHSDLISRFGKPAVWPKPQWLEKSNMPGCDFAVLTEMNACQMLRGIEKELEEWIGCCDRPEPQKRRLRLLLEDCDNRLDKIVLIARKPDGLRTSTSYYALASDIPDKIVVRKSWTKALPFSVAQVDPIERLTGLGYLPQEAASQDTELVLLGYRSVPLSRGEIEFSGINWSYKPEYDNFLAAVERLDSSKTEPYSTSLAWFDLHHSYSAE